MTTINANEFWMTFLGITETTHNADAKTETKTIDADTNSHEAYGIADEELGGLIAKAWGIVRDEDPYCEYTEMTLAELTEATGITFFESMAA